MPRPLTQADFNRIKMITNENNNKPSHSRLTFSKLAKELGCGESTVYEISKHNDFKSYRDYKWNSYVKYKRKTFGYEPIRQSENINGQAKPIIETTGAYLDVLIDRLGKNVETLKETISLVIDEAVKVKMKEYDQQHQKEITESKRILEEAKLSNWTDSIKNKFGGML